MWTQKKESPLYIVIDNTLLNKMINKNHLISITFPNIYICITIYKADSLFYVHILFFQFYP